jgi:porphobilinogen synthase
MSTFPVTRLRRLRRTEGIRSLVRETRLSLDEFVFPLFVAPETERNGDLPGMSRLSLDDLAAEADELAALGVPAVILFGIPEEKDDEGTGAYDEDGIVQRALRVLRERAPGLVLLTDVCLCEYTSHGHCGLIREGEVDNDETLGLLARTAVSHVDAGADVVCPSDMMDGRVGAIREALPQTPIVAYSAKYASAFYGPFREAVASSLHGDRKTYQQDPANIREALREVALDVAEGADVVMVKPALGYLDVLRAVRESVDIPVAAYNVSGEYAMVEAAAKEGWINRDAAIAETLTSIRRAGADVILTYWALEFAQSLRDGKRGERKRSRLVGSVEPSPPSSERFDGPTSSEFQSKWP